ncbi:MAG TPA: cobaltochelatase subunit CobT, partial [Patescibacteria group bacterium]|nr:cobaltochelatase subunit CobT [Patescibacteria group bacterium]
MSDSNDPVENFKHATQSTARALSGREDLEISFGGHLAEISGHSIKLPALPKMIEDAEASLVRGMADTFALKLNYHDAGTHQKMAPADPRARLAYQALEDARIEAVGTEIYPGASSNIEAALRYEAKRQKLEHVSNMDDAPLAEALRFMARESFTGRKPPKEALKVVKVWQGWIDKHLGADGLEALRKSLHSQEDFAKIVHHLIDKMDMPSAPSEPPPQPQEDQSQEEQKSEGAEKAAEQDTSKSTPPTDVTEEAESGEAAEADAESMAGQEMDDQEFDDADDNEDARKNTPRDHKNAHYGDYKIYTAQFDEIVDARDLCEPEELQKLRKMLDKQLTHLQGVITRLANKLQRKLLAQQTRSWQFDLEEGILDSARLSRAVANPYWPVSYKQESETDFRDTVVSLLIDNSGSMRGRPITIAAMSTDILARTLE